MKKIKFPFLLFLSYLLLGHYCLSAQNDSIVYIHGTDYISIAGTDNRVSYYDFYHNGTVSFFDKPAFAENLKGRKPLIFKVGATGVYGQDFYMEKWFAGGGFNVDFIFPAGKTLTKKNVLAFSIRLTHLLSVRSYYDGSDFDFFPTLGNVFLGFDVLTRMCNTSYFYFSVKSGVVMFYLPSQQLDFGFGFKIKNILAIEPYCTLQILDFPISIAGRIGLNFLIFHVRKQKT